VAVLFNFSALVGHPNVDATFYTQPETPAPVANSNLPHAQVHSQWRLDENGRLETCWRPDLD
jgi:hypothetical protein